jgi:hypothetical protein
MTWRRIAVYYVLSVILGGYYLAFEWRPNPEKPIRGPRQVVQNRFLPLAREDIHELVLRRANAIVQCRRNGDTWETIEPSGAKITSAIVASLIENLTLGKEVQVVDRSAADLKPYGLAPPYSTLELKGKEKNPLTTVLIGDRNPTESAVYARLENSPQVVLLGYSVRYYEELIFEAAGFSRQ